MVAKARDGRAALAGARSPSPQVLPGLVWAFRFRADGVPEELPVDQPIDGRQDGWLWLHFDSADPHAAEVLSTFTRLPAPALDQLLSQDDHQQLHADDVCVYGTFADLIRGADDPEKEIGFLHFAMTEKLLVSNRRHAIHAVDATRQALRQGRKVATVAALLAAIMEHVVDAVDDYAEEIAGELETIEEKILAGEADDLRLTLGRIRRTTVRLHRQLTMSRSLLNRLEYKVSEPAIPIGLPTEKLGQRLDWLDGEIVALRDRAHLLQEEVTLKISEETNRHLEVLSIVATIFLPATLIAGIFGMNVKGLPFTEDGYGFVWSMGILIGASVVIYWLLKRMGALGR